MGAPAPFLAQKTDGDITQFGGVISSDYVRSLVAAIQTKAELLQDINVDTCMFQVTPIETVNIGTRISFIDTPGTKATSDKEGEPVITPQSFSCKPMRAVIPITFRQAEDRRNAGDFGEFVKDLAARQIALDVQEAAIEADSSNSALIDELKQFDGFLAMAGNQIDVSALTTIDSAVFACWQNLPQRYWQAADAANFRIYMGHRTWGAYANEIQNSTVRVHANLYENPDPREQVKFFGIPVRSLAMPEGKIWLTHRMNAMVRFWIQMTYGVDHYENAGVDEHVWRYAHDQKYQEPNGAVVGDGVAYDVLATTA